MSQFGSSKANDRLAKADLDIPSGRGGGRCHQPFAGGRARKMWARVVAPCGGA
jgi:hypothetical protein